MMSDYALFSMPPLMLLNASLGDHINLNSQLMKKEYAAMQYRAFIPFPIQAIPENLSVRIEWLCRRYYQAQTVEAGLPPAAREKKWRRFWRTITPIERSIVYWLCLAENYESSPVAENAWRYEPPATSEIFALAKLKHDIVRHYLPADDLKMLITVYQASNYGLLTDELINIGLLPEKAIVDIAERFVNADSLDGEFQYELDAVNASDYQIIEQQLFLNDVCSEIWTRSIKAIIDVSMQQRIRAAIDGEYLTFPPENVYFSLATSEVTFDFPKLELTPSSPSDKSARNIH